MQASHMQASGKYLLSYFTDSPRNLSFKRVSVELTGLGPGFQADPESW